MDYSKLSDKDLKKEAQEIKKRIEKWKGYSREQDSWIRENFYVRQEMKKRGLK